MPGVGPDSVTGVSRSKLDPSWASVRFAPEGESKPFFVFVERAGDKWEAKKSLRADEADYAKNEVVPLAEVPKDLIQYLYPENAFVADVPEPKQEKVDELPERRAGRLPPPEPVSDGVPDAQRERVEKALEAAAQRIEGYDGVAGVYVQDLEGDFSYGVRPDEEFFTASIIKVPVMVAVYRKVDEGELSFSQMIEIKEEDWAARGRVAAVGEGGDQADRGRPAAPDDDPVGQRRHQRPRAHGRGRRPRQRGRPLSGGPRTRSSTRR